MGLRGHNINNAAAAVEDYRTGEILAYVGSASYTSKGSKKFQPQFDVLSDGWRQPGSAIKPVDYLIGIDDKTLTASTMFMDVTTNFGGGFIPTQADNLERGPVRLRSALQFSLNIPAIKATIMSGLDHVYDRTKDFGLTYPKTALPVLSEGIGTLEVHPIDLLGAYGTIANSGVLMPHRYIGTVAAPVHRRGRLAQARGAAEGQARDLGRSRLHPHGHPRRATPTRRSTRSGASGRSTTARPGGRRRTRPARPATTATWRPTASSPHRPTRRRPPWPSGVWMGNSDNSPNDGKLSLDTSAPLWSAILTEVSKGMKIASFKPPSGLKSATVDAFTGLKPGPFTKKTVKELFLPGTVPTQKETIRVAASIDKASGLLWREGCAGPKITKGFFNLSEVESNFPAWQKANANWGARAAKGSGVRGGPKGTRTAYFYNGAFTPFGRSWGAPFKPTAQCPLYTPPQYCNPFAPTPAPSAAEPPCIALPTPPPFGGPTNKPFPTRKPRETPRPR